MFWVSVSKFGWGSLKISDNSRVVRDISTLIYTRSIVLFYSKTQILLIQRRYKSANHKHNSISSSYNLDRKVESSNMFEYPIPVELKKNL